MTKKYFSTSEAAAYLGLTLNELKNLIYYHKDIRGQLVAGSLVFRRGELDRYQSGQPIEGDLPPAPLSSTQAAEYVGLKHNTFKYHVFSRGDNIKSHLVGNARVYTTEDLDAFEKKPQGRPKVKDSSDE